MGGYMESMQSNNNKIKRAGGFTLIEILIVIGIISILAAIVIVAVNPARQFSQARNAQRRADTNTILNATYQYAVDATGTLPVAIPLGACGTATTQQVCKTAGGGTCTGLVDLSVLTDNETYLVAMPTDPSGPADSNPNGAGYHITKSSNGRVTVCATQAELGVAVSVTR